MGTYTPAQHRTDDHEVFREVCRRQNIALTDGFRLAVEAWVSSYNLTRSEILRDVHVRNQSTNQTTNQSRDN